MRKTEWSYTLIFLLLLACNNKNVQEQDLITVDVTISYPKKILILQDLFDIEYVSLETSDEYITSGTPNDIEGDCLLISDAIRNNTGNIFLFGKDGKGIKKISRLGQGAEEYTINLGCIFDLKEKELFVNNYVSRKIMVYDQDGNFKRSLNQKENFYYDKLENFNQDYLLCHDGYLSLKDEVVATRNYFMLVSKKDGSIKEISIPYKKNIYPLVTAEAAEGEIIYCIYNSPQIPYQDKGFLLMEASSDTIYHYTSNQQLIPRIVRTPSILLLETKIFLYPGVQTDRYCFMQTVENIFNAQKEVGFPVVELVYDRQKETIYECEMYNNDFLKMEPMTMVYNFHDRLYFQNSKDVAFMKKLEAADLVEAYEDGKLKDGPLKEIASTLDEEDNPIIMIAKYKK